jgi:outer membrane receptor protein involved in Fe transport
MLCLALILCDLAHTSTNEADNQQEVYQLKEISVTPGRFSISDSTQSPYIMPKMKMEKLPLIDNDIYRAAHNLPGVVADDFSARFSLRGGDRDETVVRLDGMELYDPYHLQDFGGAISVIDMGLVESADLLTGGFPVEYGDAMSGVFDIRSKQVGKERISGNMGVDLLNTHLILEGPLSGASWLLSARRGYIDLLMGLIESEETFRPSYYDIYSKMSYDVSTADRISAHVLYAGDSNEMDEAGDENDLNSRYWNGMLWAGWHHRKDEKASWNLYIFSGRAGREKYEGVDGVDERWLHYAGLKGDMAYELMPAQTLKSGWRWQWSEADYSYFLSEDQTVIAADVRRSGWNLSGYLQDDWQIAGRLAGNMGLRFTHQSYGKHFAVMPRVALAARLRNNLLVRGAWGMYHQPVQVTGLPVEQGIVESQPPEKAVHYVAGVEYSPTARLSLKTEAYFKTFDDLVDRIKDYGRKEQLFTVPASGSARGVEVFLSIRQIPLPLLPRHLSSLGLGYALSRSEVETEAGKIPRDFDRRHSLSLSADYTLWGDGWLNVTWRYHTGDPYTEVWYEKTPSESNEEAWQKNYGALNGKRYPSYHSLDVRLTKNFRFRKWELSLYVQIMNLYNRKNVHEYSFEKILDENGEILSYQETVEGLLPILPSLGLSARF